MHIIRRDSRRLPRWDYAGPGWYFVTCVIWQRRPFLAELRSGQSYPTLAGEIVADAWQAIPDHFPGVHLDAFVVMPDHVHGIVRVDARDDPHRRPPRVSGTPPRSLGAIIGSWKSASSRGIHRNCAAAPPRIWQRNYHEWVVRNEAMLERVRRYIARNPSR